MADLRRYTYKKLSKSLCLFMIYPTRIDGDEVENWQSVSLGLLYVILELSLIFCIFTGLGVMFEVKSYLGACIS